MLEARKISRRVADRVLLKGVSAQIQAGQRIALQGPNGSGKSLFLRTLAMLEPMDQGTLIWRDQVIDASNAALYRSQVIYVRQQAARFEGTVQTYLKLPFQLSIHRHRDYDEDRVAELLERCNLPPSFPNRRMTELSGGETQLVALVAAIQLDPSLLLLDEPTAALASETARAAEALVTSWIEQAVSERAFIWITHDPDQSRRIASEAWRMQDGTLHTRIDGNG